VGFAIVWFDSGEATLTAKIMWVKQTFIVLNDRGLIGFP
jgi:hypothetical protein